MGGAGGGGAAIGAGLLGESVSHRLDREVENVVRDKV